MADIFRGRSALMMERKFFCFGSLLYLLRWQISFSLIFAIDWSGNKKKEEEKRKKRKRRKRRFCCFCC